MNDLIPLMIDLKGKKVVIFGGGDVGERKALLFAGHAEVVVVISREFTPGLKRLSLDGKIISVEIKEMDEGEIIAHIEGAFIVIPATSDKLLNENIGNMAKSRGILVNRVDDLGDVIVPSVIKRGDIVIGISTQSSSPALSKFMRIKIESVITPEFENMAVLQNDIRKKLKSSIKEQRTRKEILWNILNDNDIWAALGESYEKAYNIALKHMDKRK